MMKTEKYYTQPQFEFVRTHEQNKVFFAASGGAPSPGVTGSINTMTSSTQSLGWI